MYNAATANSRKKLPNIGNSVVATAGYWIGLLGMRVGRAPVSVLKWGCFCVLEKKVALKLLK